MPGGTIVEKQAVEECREQAQQSIIKRQASTLHARTTASGQDQQNLIKWAHTAESGSMKHSQDCITSASPLYDTTRRLDGPTLRINDDDDYDVNHNDDDSATTNNHSAHHKQADTTHH